LDLHDAHLINFLKEGEQSSLQAAKTILVDSGPELHDRQVLVVLGVATRHKDFMTKGRPLDQLIEDEALGNMGDGVASLVRHD
jgi:hypothetical protein